MRLPVAIAFLLHDIRPTIRHFSPSQSSIKFSAGRAEALIAGLVGFVTQVVTCLCSSVASHLLAAGGVSCFGGKLQYLMGDHAGDHPAVPGGGASTAACHQCVLHLAGHDIPGTLRNIAAPQKLSLWVPAPYTCVPSARIVLIRSIRH